MQQLTDCINNNAFFTIPENADGFLEVGDQPCRHLTVTFNGNTHTVEGYNTTNSRFLAITHSIDAFDFLY